MQMVFHLHLLPSTSLTKKKTKMRHCLEHIKMDFSLQQAWQRKKTKRKKVPCHWFCHVNDKASELIECQKLVKVIDTCEEKKCREQSSQSCNCYFWYFPQTSCQRGVNLLFTSHLMSRPNIPLRTNTFKNLAEDLKGRIRCMARKNVHACMVLEFTKFS